MKIISQNIEAWEVDPVPTERTGYQLLTEVPIDREVTYYALPWAPLLNNQLRIDFSCIERSPRPAFTICQHIQYEAIIKCCRFLGVETIFTPHASKAKCASDGVSILPFPHFPVNGVAPAVAKDILFSFVGAPQTHWSRELFREYSDGYIRFRDTWHFWGTSQETSKQEYQSILARSVFALCPRGTGLGTLRFWEALQAAAIPVLIADDLALPPGVDWSRCTISITEEESVIRGIPKKLAAMDPETIREMRAHVHSAYLATVAGPNFVNPVRIWAKALPEANSVCY